MTWTPPEDDVIIESKAWSPPSDDEIIAPASNDIPTFTESELEKKGMDAEKPVFESGKYISKEPKQFLNTSTPKHPAAVATSTADIDQGKQVVRNLFNSGEVQTADDFINNYNNKYAFAAQTPKDKQQKLFDYAKTYEVYKPLMEKLTDKIQTKPHSVDDINNLASIYDALGDHATAQSLYIHSQDTKDNVGAKWGIAGHTYMEGDVDSAKKQFQQLADEHPDFTPAKQNLAFIDAQQGNLEGATKNIDKAITANPDDWWNWAMSSNINYRRGDDDAANEDEKIAKSKWLDQNINAIAEAEQSKDEKKLADAKANMTAIADFWSGKTQGKDKATQLMGWLMNPIGQSGQMMAEGIPKGVKTTVEGLEKFVPKMGMDFSPKNQAIGVLQTLGGLGEVAFTTGMGTTLAGIGINMAMQPLPHEAQEFLFAPLEVDDKKTLGNEIKKTANTLWGLALFHQMHQAGESLPQPPPPESPSFARWRDNVKSILKDVTPDEVQGAIKSYRAMPNDLTWEQQKDVLPLQIQHDKLVTEMENVGEAFKPALQQKIKNIQQQINETINPELKKEKPTAEITKPQPTGNKVTGWDYKTGKFYVEQGGERISEHNTRQEAEQAAFGKQEEQLNSHQQLQKDIADLEGTGEHTGEFKKTNPLHHEQIDSDISELLDYVADKKQGVFGGGLQKLDSWIWDSYRKIKKNETLSPEEKNYSFNILNEIHDAIWEYNDEFLVDAEQKKTSEELKKNENDNQDRTRVSSEVGIREKPLEAESVTGAGEEEVGDGGMVQKPQEVKEVKIIPQVEVTSDELQHLEHLKELKSLDEEGFAHQDKLDELEAKVKAGKEEGNKIAQDNGYDSATHLLNSVKKNVGQDFATVQQALKSPEVQKFLKDKAETAAAQPAETVNTNTNGKNENVGEIRKGQNGGQEGNEVQKEEKVVPGGGGEKPSPSVKTEPTNEPTTTTRISEPVDKGADKGKLADSGEDKPSISKIKSKVITKAPEAKASAKKEGVSLKVQKDDLLNQIQKAQQVVEANGIDEKALKDAGFKTTMSEELSARRGQNPKLQVVFDVEGDGTFHLAADGLKEAHEQVKKHWDIKEQTEPVGWTGGFQGEKKSIPRANRMPSRAALGDYSTLESAEESRKIALDNLEEAKKSGNKKLIETYQKQAELESEKYIEAKRRFEDTASRIRAKKIGKDNAYMMPDLGISKALYNSALEFCAKQVEKGTQLGKAIENTIKFFDKHFKDDLDRDNFRKHLKQSAYPQDVKWDGNVSDEAVAADKIDLSTLPRIKVGFSFDDVVDATVKLIHKGIDVHGDITKAIDEALEKIKGTKLYKDIIGDKGADFENMVRSSIETKTESLEHGEGKKAVVGRVHEGDVPKNISEAVEKHGLNYTIESHPEAEKKASDFIADVGVEKALNAAREGKIDGGAETFVWTAAIDAVHKEYLAESNPSKKEKLLEKETGLIDEFDKKMRSQGRSISALQAAYQTADLGYKLGAILNRAKEASGESGVSEILKEKLIDLSSKLDEVTKKLAEAEKKLKETPPPKIIKEPLGTKRSKHSLSSEEFTRKQELSKKYRGVFNDVTRVITTIAEKEFREYAGLVLKEAAGDFKIFAREMINTVGKEIREHLPKLYKELGGKENPEMERIQKQLKREIDEYERRKREKDFTKKEPKEKTNLDEETFNLLVEKNRLKEEIDTEIERERLKNRSIGEKINDGFIDAVSLPKSLMASADMSAPLRQGAVLSFRHPIMASHAIKEMFRQAFSEKKSKEWLTRLKSTPEYYDIKKAGLYLAEPTARLTAKEEQFISNIAHHIPVWGKIVKGSERAYTGYLNKLRVDAFTAFHDALLRDGFKGKQLDAELKSYADFVNNASGRGSLGKFEESTPLLNAAFFSPRYVVSRFNLLNPLKYAKMTPKARMEALKTVGAYMGVGLMTMAIAKAGGADVEDDPRSADFGKIKVGNTRFDIWAGMSQLAVLLSRLATNKTKSTSGDVKVLGEGYKPTTRMDVLGRFGRSKLSPSVGIATDFLIGKDFNGNDVTVSGEVMKSILPLWSSDIYNISQDENSGPGVAAAAGAASFFGVGVQNYKNKTSKQGQNKPQPIPSPIK